MKFWLCKSPMPLALIPDPPGNARTSTEETPEPRRDRAEEHGEAGGSSSRNGHLNTKGPRPDRAEV
jgi:hypothetical protein